MYVYKVTHIPTGQYYLGLSTEPRNTFDPAKNYDPYNQFEVYGSNGTKLKMVNVEKRIERVVYSTDELAAAGAELAKLCQDDSLFLGLKGVTPATAPAVEPKTTAPKTISTN